MPKILERAVREIMKKGHNKSQAYAFATSALQKSGQLQKGSQKLTKKGKRKRV